MGVIEFQTVDKFFGDFQVLNGAAYVAEIFRFGIQSIDKGQMEAGRASRLSYA